MLKKFRPIKIIILTISCNVLSNAKYNLFRNAKNPSYLQNKHTVRFKDLKKLNLFKLAYGSKVLGSTWFLLLAPSASKNDPYFNSGLHLDSLV